jgi:hypothetical protein
MIETLEERAGVLGQDKKEDISGHAIYLRSLRIFIQCITLPQDSLSL